MTDDEPPPSLHLRRNAVRDGWSDDELARLVRSGELSRLRRGAYVNGTLPSDATAILLALGAADRALELVPGEHYFEDGGRPEVADLVAGWIQGRAG